MSSTGGCERWVWMELLGFEKTDPDRGVDRYVECAGFAPKAISLLVTAVDIVLLHDGMAKERPLPPDICSRDAHERNEDRRRQVWTNHDLRNLIAALHRRGIGAWVSFFPSYLENEHHREWLHDHHELLEVWDHHGKGRHVNPLLRFRDGSLFEDFFIPKLVATLADYGFDGWHGCDGWGPLGGEIYATDCGDDMIRQFAERYPVKLPAFFGEPYEGTPERYRDGDTPENIARLKRRTGWLWRNARREWIDFHTDRWAGFWRKALPALHAAGKQAVINSSWTRDPFEGIYRYGVDCRKIARAGVDGIVVETVAGNVGLGWGERERHYDYLAALALIRAAAPETKVIFLHGMRDIVEEYDLLRHNPVVLEKEVYALANLCHAGPDGRLRRSADGFLCCLGDGIRRDEWRWVAEKWEQAFGELPARTLGPAVVWSDAALDNQIGDFIETRRVYTHRIVHVLMELGVPVQTTVAARDIGSYEGMLLVANPGLFAPEELAAVRAYRNGPAVLIGPGAEGMGTPDVSFADPLDPDFRCEIHNTAARFVPDIPPEAADSLPGDPADVEEPAGFRGALRCRPVSRGFMRACAGAIMAAMELLDVGSAPDATISDTTASVGLMAAEMADGRIRLALFNNSAVYGRPKIEMKKPIKEVTLVTGFPLMDPRPDGRSFTVKVPPKGLTVVDVLLEGDDRVLGPG